MRGDTQSRNTDMKIVDLNIWGGRVFEPLLSFLKHNSDVDVFCFQEVFDNGQTQRPPMAGSHMDIFNQISKVLSNHNGSFCCEQENEEGIAMFIRKDLTTKDKGCLTIHKWKDEIEADGGTISRVLQWASVKKENRNYTISHFHGVWQRSGKGDTPERIKQSEKIKSFLNSVSEPKIICGDLNLAPNTKSMEIIKKGMKELITENNIQNTRSSLYLKESKHADYMFISKDIKAKDFRVLSDIVSDHLPLYLEFN